jgi:hypothetical protein
MRRCSSSSRPSRPRSSRRRAFQPASDSNGSRSSLDDGMAYASSHLARLWVAIAESHIVRKADARTMGSWGGCPWRVEPCRRRPQRLHIRAQPARRDRRRLPALVELFSRAVARAGSMRSTTSTAALVETASGSWSARRNRRFDADSADVAIRLVAFEPSDAPPGRSTLHGRDTHAGDRHHFSIVSADG